MCWALLIGQADYGSAENAVFLLTQLKISTTRSPAVSSDRDKITLVETVLISTSCEMQHHEMLRWWSLVRLWKVWKDSKGKQCDPLCLPPPRAAALIRACDDSSRQCHTVCFYKALRWSAKGLWRLILQLQGLRAFLESQNSLRWKGPLKAIWSNPLATGRDTFH